MFDLSIKGDKDRLLAFIGGYKLKRDTLVRLTDGLIPRNEDVVLFIDVNTIVLKFIKGIKILKVVEDNYEDVLASTILNTIAHYRYTFGSKDMGSHYVKVVMVYQTGVLGEFNKYYNIPHILTDEGMSMSAYEMIKSSIEVVKAICKYVPACTFRTGHDVDALTVVNSYRKKMNNINQFILTDDITFTTLLDQDNTHIISPYKTKDSPERGSIISKDNVIKHIIDVCKIKGEGWEKLDSGVSDIMLSIMGIKVRKGFIPSPKGMTPAKGFSNIMKGIESGKLMNGKYLDWSHIRSDYPDIVDRNDKADIVSAKLFSGICGNGNRIIDVQLSEEAMSNRELFDEMGDINKEYFQDCPILLDGLFMKDLRTRASKIEWVVDKIGGFGGC